MSRLKPLSLLLLLFCSVSTLQGPLWGVSLATENSDCPLTNGQAISTPKDLPPGPSTPDSSYSNKSLTELF